MGLMGLNRTQGGEISHVIDVLALEGTKWENQLPNPLQTPAQNASTIFVPPFSASSTSSRFSLKMGIFRIQRSYMVGFGLGLYFL